MDDFFQNASILPDRSDSEGIRCTKPEYQRSEETEKNDRKRKDQGNGKTEKKKWKEYHKFIFQEEESWRRS